METKKITDTRAKKASDDWTTNTTALAKLEAKKQAAIDAITSKYATKLTDHKTAIAEAEAVLKQYATENYTELFGNAAKSCEFNGCTLAFKKAPPSICIKEGWTEQKVITHLFNKYKHLTTTTITLDKAAIKKAFDSMGKELGKCGLALETKEDNFYVKL
jgi:phage host-nuclease inhibitor protein Gam